MSMSTNLWVRLGFISLALSTSAIHAAEGPNDAQIAGIVVTANSVDVDAGKLAEKESSNKEVKDFAKRMIVDHTAVNKQAGDLAAKLKLKPEDSDVSKSLADGGKKNLSHLKTLKGSAFDKAYVDHEVAYHQAVLDAIDKLLLPNAKNAELKQLIEKVRPAIAAHLDHARQMQTKMGAGR
jgi:putative membrane protein